MLNIKSKWFKITLESRQLSFNVEVKSIDTTNYPSRLLFIAKTPGTNVILIECEFIIMRITETIWYDIAMGQPV